MVIEPVGCGSGERWWRNRLVFLFFECCVACVLVLIPVVLGRVGPAPWGWPLVVQ